MSRVPTHPGEVLQEEFLTPLGITQVGLAKHISVPVQRINEIVRGKRGISPETAWLLAQAFGTTPEFWVRLQANHDLGSGEREAGAQRGEAPQSRLTSSPSSAASRCLGTSSP